MCGAKEIYCCQIHCIRPIGWYIVEPCEAFVIANSLLTQHPAGSGSWSWNWNTSTCGCSVPRVVRRQRCRYRSCITCCWSTLHSTFTAMQQWANAAREYPEWWAQSHGDNLLFRRTKRRLRSEYDQSRKDKGKKRAIDVQQALPAANSGEQWSSHPETLGTLSNQTDVFDYLPRSSLENPSNNYQSISNSNLYPSSSAVSRQVWSDGPGERFPTAQGLLGTTGVPELGQEAASTANASTMYPNSEYQLDIWRAYEPSQPNLMFEQVWGEGDATQSERPQHEVMQQTPSLNNAVLNLDDPFWNDMLAFGSEFALGSDTDTGEGGSNNPAHSLL
ncbi:hypothetical protein CI102_1842 [Trichoderma harzianum]|uniref:Uncharacterized protein n=1 Tax=Trichoderma harzianum CBS 226.95 TaxID=983964 RepID=A0A2T4ANE8_TRIHA|nr:hypothetical protein M431DRAFT_490224 [Trichoderma harzianum CBS 226.95]PKK53604.1 hypothetical protein CI102_1842 [Trichoderma harzianum]PTB58606.1 hypothetical protein M431DRAFT_490224 [Trichoderma harzianum CBS 226.95]